MMQNQGLRVFTILLTCLLCAVSVSCEKDQFDEDSGSFRDSRDGNRYSWVRIGEQIWMVENLAYLPFVSSLDSILSTRAEYYVYEYEGSRVSEARDQVGFKLYGVLYNWPAALTGCPKGWRLPYESDWDQLAGFLGPEPGNLLKSSSGWHYAGDGDNSAGFNALPGGSRDDGGGFHHEGYTAFFWSADARDDYFGWTRSLSFQNERLNRDYEYKRSGFSVRCIRE